MGCKVGLGALFFLLASGALFFSCSRKYDYGNIDTPNSLSGLGGSSLAGVPVLSGSVRVEADWMLDSEGLGRVRSMVESFPDRLVELDLGGCPLPAGEFGESTIAVGALENLVNLGSVVLPETLSTVPASLFRGCVSLRSVNLPDGLVSIEGHPFEGCVSLREIHAGAKPLYIFSYAGDGLSPPDMEPNLKSVDVMCGQNSVDYAGWYQFCLEYTRSMEPKKVSFAEIWASSFEEGYGPGNLGDGSWGTWFEGAAGDGVGQEIVMHFTRMNSVSTVTFRNGNGNTKNFWKSNRVKDLDIYFGDETVPFRVTLDDTCEKQTFRFLYGQRKLRQYDKIRMAIRSVYPGGRGDETCVAEIAVNDEEMPGFVEDPYTRGMVEAIPLSDDVETESEYRIWRPRDSYPVMLMFNTSRPAEDLVTDSLVCMVYDGNGWAPAKKSVWSPLADVVSAAEKNGRRTEFSFHSDGDVDGDFDFRIQLKRRVERYEDADYGTPYLFDFDGTRFVLGEDADFSMKRVSVSTESFFSELERMDPRGIYRIDLYGELGSDFFRKMGDLLSADSELAINRNYILNMWGCTFAPELKRTLLSDSICGYFIQLVLPETTRRIMRSSISVAADIISIPPGVEKIEAGAFVSSGGSLYDVYRNNVAFGGKNMQNGYSVDGRLLLESIPDSGGAKRVLLYCGNSDELLGGKAYSGTVVLPDSVTEIAPYAFYGADLDAIVFPKKFSSAGEKCFDLARVSRVDLSETDVEKFSMETVRQFGVLLSSNPGVSLSGDFYCVSASGKMTDGLVAKIVEELGVRKDKKVYLDLGGTSLVLNDVEKKFNPLPDMFLYDFQNLYWVRMGSYNYFPQNTCRDCHQLRCVEFLQQPDRIAEPSFRGCHATAVAIVNGRSYPLWDYAQGKK